MTAAMARNSMNDYKNSDSTDICAENLAAGNDAPEEIILQLIIDDGVPSRGHRTNLLTPDFNIVGAAIIEHPQWRHSCTMDLGEIEKEKEITIPTTNAGTSK